MGKGIGESQIWAFLAVFLGILGFIIVMLTQRKDKYVMFYAKQCLVLMIAWILACFVVWIPFIGWAIGLVMFVLWIITIINSLSGAEKPTPIIGKFAEKFKF